MSDAETMWARAGRRAARAAALTGLAGLAVLGAAAPAQADEDDWAVTRYDVAAQIDPDGAAQVTVDLTFDFGPDDDAHGPYIAIVERQEIEGDPDRYRLMEVSDVEVTSATGAPTDLLIERDDGAVVVRVGDEDVEIGGAQDYTISYRIESLATPGEAADAQDRLLWNAVGLGWEVPLEDVSVRIEAPESEDSLTCVAGGVGSTQVCDGATTSGDVGVTVEQSRLEPGQGLTIDALYPPDTFPDADVQYAPRRTFANAFALTPTTGAVAGASLVGGLALVLGTRRRRRDAAAPAVAGALGQGVPEGFRTEPPADVPPGEFGTVIDEHAQPHDVVAVLLDLAVRGALHIEVIPNDDDATDGVDGATDDGSDEKPDFQLIRVAGPHDLRDYEKALLDDIFQGTETVLVSKRGAQVAKAVASAAVALDDTVTAHGWFEQSPRKVRGKWLSLGVGLTLVGLFGGLVAALTLGWGLVGFAVLVLGLVITVMAPSMPTRTARGSEVTREAQEFERFLRDVTDETPTWAAGRERLVPDVFERYLPYAVALKLEERWTQAFSDAIAGGQVRQPDWYTAPNMMTWAALGHGGYFGESLSGFTGGVVSSGVASASSGGSGYSPSVGGGGASGGGGGGW